MPLVLTRNPALLSLQPMAQEAEANEPPVISTYTPTVERWRKQVWESMPPQLRARPDAAVLLDKALYVIDGESGGRPDAVGDGGAAWGLAQSHHIPAGSDAGTQIRDMWRLVANNPDQWTDWGEGTTYNGQVFGALGNKPYGGGGEVRQGGTFGEPVKDGGRAQSWFQQARDNVVAMANQKQNADLSYDYGDGIRPPDDADWVGTQGVSVRGGIAGMGDRARDYLSGADLPPNAIPGKAMDDPFTGLPSGNQITPPTVGSAGLQIAPRIALPDTGAPLNPLDVAGDVPYASGQGQPGTYAENVGSAGNAGLTIDQVMQQAGLDGGISPRLPDLGDVKNAALAAANPGAYVGSNVDMGAKIGGPYGAFREQAIKGAGAAGRFVDPVLGAPFRVQSPGGPGGPGGASMPGKSPVEAAAETATRYALPETYLDAALTAGPEFAPAARAIKAGAPVLPTIARGAVGALVPGLAGLNDEAARGVRTGAANIVGDADSVRKKVADAAKQYSDLLNKGLTDEDIKAFPGGQAMLDLVKGGTASQKAAQNLPNLTGEAQSRAARTTYETVLKDTGSVEMATAEARKAAAVEQEATQGLRGRAGALSERMGAQTPPGAMGITDVQRAEHAKPGTVVTGYRGSRGDGYGYGATEGRGTYLTHDPETAAGFGDVSEIKYKAPSKPLKVDNEPLYLLENGDPDIEGLLEEGIKKSDSMWTRLNKMAAHQAGEFDGGWEDRYADALTALMKGRGYDAVDVTSGDMKWRVLLDDALRQVPGQPHYLPGGPGVVEKGMQGAGRAVAAEGDTAAAVAERNRIADRMQAREYPASAGDTVAGVARVARDLGDPFMAARDLYKRSGGQQQAVEGEPGKRRTPEENAALRAARTAGPGGNEFLDAARAEKAAQAEATAREADQAAIAARTAGMAQKGGGAEAVVQAARTRAQEAADAAEQARIDLEDAQAATGFRQQAGEARTGNERATRAEIEAHQARVEAADLERRKAAWQLGQAEEAAMNEAKGRDQGGWGKHIAAILQLPRALSLSSDIGTARDLGLFVGTKEGRAAAARGGKAALRSIIHSDADARRVMEGAQDGSRWFKWASDEKNLPKEIPFHSYDFGPGAKVEARSPEFSGLNDSPISTFVQQIHPGIRFSDRGMAVQRNIAGIDLLESRLDELAMKYGVTGPADAAQNARFLSEAQSTISSINHMRGFSGGRQAKALGVLNALTSPQQLYSRLQILGDPINFAIRGDTESAKFAAANLAGFAASQGSLLALARLTGGGGRWSVNLNPTDSDFGTIKVGNTRYDTMAGLGPTMRLFGKIGSTASDAAFDTDYAKNQAELGILISRFLENKESPFARVVTDFMLHNKLPNEQTAINMIAPSIATGLMQTLAEERGSPLAIATKTAAAGVANFGGVGVNTYESGKDTANYTAQDLFGKGYDELATPQKLSVLAQLPAEATKGAGNPKQVAKQDFEAARKQTPGYSEPEPKPEGGETKSEETKREARNEARAKDNAEVYKKNPELDVQRWFFSDSDTLGSPAAVTQALALNAPERTVRYSGAARDLNNDQGKRLWKDTQQQVADFYSPKTITAYREVADYYAQNRYGKNYAQLSPEDKAKIETTTRTAYREDHPELDALMAYMGFSGSSETKRYLVHSKAAQAPLEALRAKYGRDAARKDEGWGFAVAANAR